MTRPVRHRGLFAVVDGTPMLGPRQFEELAAEVEHGLDAAKTTAASEGAPRVAAKLLQGKPDVEILHVAREGGFDLIVMGTHGRTGFKHVLLGSVSERVVRYAARPVFTVKALASLSANAAPPS